jgi:hypothetical protein
VPYALVIPPALQEQLDALPGPALAELTAALERAAGLLGRSAGTLTEGMRVAGVRVPTFVLATQTHQVRYEVDRSGQRVLLCALSPAPSPSPGHPGPGLRTAG